MRAFWWLLAVVAILAISFAWQKVPPSAVSPSEVLPTPTMSDADTVVLHRKWIWRQLENEVGSVVAESLVDIDALAKLSGTGAAKLVIDNATWKIHRLVARPRVPECMETMGGRLLALKQSMSLFISRMAADKALANFPRRLAQGFVRNIIRGALSQSMIFLQLLLEEKHYPIFKHEDEQKVHPILEALRQIRVDGTINEAEATLLRPLSRELHADYLFFAGNSHTTGHSIVSLGSNNEYDWELSIAKAFRVARGHGIRQMTTFDCTLKEWTPPKTLLDAHVGYGTVSKCVGATRDDFTIRIRDLRETLREVRRTPTRHRTTDATLFDEITLFKCDVEGFEHTVLAHWLSDEMSTLKKGREEFVDFATAATPSVSMVVMELHRPGHTRLYGASFGSALQTHLTMLHLYAIGLVMIAQEKNPTDYCCYEVSMVHYRHYVRSEVWLRERGVS